MKKYIRTRDGILDTKLLVKCNDERIENGWLTKNGVPIIAIKQADTIEELLDACVRKNSEFCSVQHWSVIKHNKNKILNALKEEKEEVYGAIWTNKGLIYVAKMNDKGEFELI